MRPAGTQKEKEEERLQEAEHLKKNSNYIYLQIFEAYQSLLLCS